MAGLTPVEEVELISREPREGAEKVVGISSGSGAHGQSGGGGGGEYSGGSSGDGFRDSCGGGVAPTTMETIRTTNVVITRLVMVR